MPSIIDQHIERQLNHKAAADMIDALYRLPNRRRRELIIALLDGRAEIKLAAPPVMASIIDSDDSDDGYGIRVMVVEYKTQFERMIEQLPGAEELSRVVGARRQ